MAAAAPINLNLNLIIIVCDSEYLEVFTTFITLTLITSSNNQLDAPEPAGASCISSLWWWSASVPLPGEQLQSGGEHLEECTN